jgi:putative nucleotidyltransferase with HDIG domain
MRQKLIDLIPEFNWFEEQKLKEKTINIWEKAIKKRKMQPEDLLRMPFTLLIDPCPANFIEHNRGVVQVSFNAGKSLKKIYGDKIKICLDYLLCGALLHDIGKILEYIEINGKFVKSKEGKYLRHPFSGVALAYSEEIPDEILHMIAVHAGEGNGRWRSTEGIIIHHADYINFEPLHQSD